MLVDAGPAVEANSGALDDGVEGAGEDEGEGDAGVEAGEGEAEGEEDGNVVLGAGVVAVAGVEAGCGAGWASLRGAAASDDSLAEVMISGLLPPKGEKEAAGAAAAAEGSVKAAAVSRAGCLAFSPAWGGAGAATPGGKAAAPGGAG